MGYEFSETGRKLSRKTIVRECPQEPHLERGNSFMSAYQFYCMGEDGKNHLIAILPERRRNPERINDWSILNWAKEVIGNGCNWQSIYFVEVNHRAMESRN